MTKSMVAILTTSLMMAACGGGERMPASTDAAPPAPAAEAPAAPAAEPALVPAEPARPAPERARKPSAPATPSMRPVEPAAVRPASAASSSVAPAPAVPEYREFTLPAGMTLPVELRSVVASDASEVEDTVRGTLRRGITIDGYEVLPAGTELTGSVTEAERSGRVKGRAKVTFRFTSLRYDGERLQVQTDPIAQEAEATKGEDATKVGVGAGAGAVIGGLIGGASGAAKGAAIGGAAGAGTVMATRGKEVRLEPGTEVSARLSAPLAVRVRLQ